MRLIFLFLTVIGLMIQGPAIVGTSAKPTQNIPMVTAKVDERVELLSIVARLAGYEEYVNHEFKSYVSDVERHFGAYRNHPAVELARKLRKDRGVSHDAVMAMAIHLNPPPELTPRIPFTATAPERRWGKEEGEKFATLLQRFYRETDAAAFFKAHAEMYRTAEERFQQLLTKVDFGWYKRFYGELPQGDFHLCIGLLNGGGNYGPKVVFPHGREDLYAVIGTWQFDSAGLPLYDERNLSTIIHEYNHSFINPLVYAHERYLKDSGPKIYPYVGAEMRSLAYGTWQIMTLESLVRAAVIRYTIEHEPDAAKQRNAIIAQRNLGFIWMEDLVNLLDKYEKYRDTYRKFSSFMPVIVNFYKDLAPGIEQRVASFNALRPTVLSTSPFANGAQDVDPGITEVTFTFDRPLEPKGISIDLGPGGITQFPIRKVIGFGEEGKTLTLQLKMQPASDYEFILTERSFKTRDGYPLRPFTMKFKTR